MSDSTKIDGLSFWGNASLLFPRTASGISRIRNKIPRYDTTPGQTSLMSWQTTMKEKFGIRTLELGLGLSQSLVTINLHFKSGLTL